MTPLTVIPRTRPFRWSIPSAASPARAAAIESTQHEAQQMAPGRRPVGCPQVDEGAAPPPMERLDLTDLVEGELPQFESVVFERRRRQRSRTRASWRAAMR